MVILENAFLCGILAVVFSIVIFVIILSFQNARFFYRFIKGKYILNLIFNIILGFVCGLIYLLIYYVTNVSNTNDLVLNLTFCTAIILPGLLCIDVASGIGIALGALGMLMLINFQFFTINLNEIFTYVITIYVAYMLLVLIFKSIILVKHTYLRLIYVDIFLAVLLIILISVYSTNIHFINDVKNINELLMQTIILFVSILISQWASQSVLIIFNKSQQFNRNALFYNDQFIKYKFIYAQLNEFIRQNNIQYAYVMMLYIDGEDSADKKVDHDTQKQIEKIINKQIINNFNKFLTLFFQDNNNRLFCVVKATSQDIANIFASYDNDNDDHYSSSNVLHKINLLDQKLKKTINIKDQAVKSIVKIFVSIYGLHSNDMHNCIDLCNVVSTNSNSSEFIQIYNPSNYFIENDYTMAHYELNKYFKDKDIEIEFQQVTLRNKVFSCVNFSCSSRSLFSFDEIIKILPMNLQAIYIRHLSALALQRYSASIDIKQFPIIINYPISFIASDKFNINNFINKTKLFSLDHKQICLMIDIGEIDNINSIAIKNLQALTAMGINIIFNNINTQNIHIIHKFNPWFIYYQNLSAPTAHQQAIYDRLMHQLLHRHHIKYYGRQQLSI